MHRGFDKGVPVLCEAILGVEHRAVTNGALSHVVNDVVGVVERVDDVASAFLELREHDGVSELTIELLQSIEHGVDPIVHVLDEDGAAKDSENLFVPRDADRWFLRRSVDDVTEESERFPDAVEGIGRVLA